MAFFSPGSAAPNANITAEPVAAWFVAAAVGISCFCPPTTRSAAPPARSGYETKGDGYDGLVNIYIYIIYI